MYFNSRAEAGRIIAQKLEGYEYKNCTIVALSRGAVLIGAQIAVKLHCNMMMLMTENINLPGEPTPIAAMADANTMTYNHAYSDGEIEELSMEYFNYIEQQRLETIHRLHTLMDASGQVNKDLLRHHVIIVVSDGLSTGLSLDVASDYLKPIKINKLIAVCPVVTPQALDRMRLFADEVHCLNVTDNFIDTDHYYDDNTIPEKDGIYKIIRDISLNWERPDPTKIKAPKTATESKSSKPSTKASTKASSKEDDEPAGKLQVKHDSKEDDKAEDKPETEKSKTKSSTKIYVKEEKRTDASMEGIMLIRH